MGGTHTLDLTLWMFEGRRPVEVVCRTRHLGVGFEGDDATTIIVTFDDGTFATNYISVTNHPIRHQILIEGRTGSVFLDHTGDHEGTVGAADTRLELNGQRVECPDEPNCFEEQMREFAEAIRDGREPLTSANRVLPVYAVLDAARESASTGRPIGLEVPVGGQG